MCQPSQNPNPDSRTAAEAMRQIDALLSHVWMVRTFLKHSDEALEEDDLRGVQRALYDVMLALGPAWQAQEPNAYLRQMGKKLGRLRTVSEQFTLLQPEISTHTNFQMAAQSLRQAVLEIEKTLQAVSRYQSHETMPDDDVNDPLLDRYQKYKS